MASNKPKLVAFRWSFAGNLFADIEINTILSMPNTISKKVRVNRATQASGLVRISNTIT